MTFKTSKFFPKTKKMALSPEELLLAQRMTYQVSQEILSRLQASNREEDDD